MINISQKINDYNHYDYIFGFKWIDIINQRRK